MDYQIKPKQTKPSATEQEILKAMTDFHTSGISTEDFCGALSRRTTRSRTHFLDEMKAAIVAKMEKEERLG